MVFHWRLSDSKSPQVSCTLLSILAVFNNAVVWMGSTRPPTSKSSRPFNIPLVTVPKAPITIGIIVTFMFHSFFNSLARSKYLFLFSHSFSFILWSAGTAKSTILQIFFFFLLLIIIRSGLLAEIRWSVCISKSHRSVCVCHFSRCWVVHIPFVGMVKFKLLAHFPVDHLAHPVVSSLVLLLCQFAAFAYYVNDGFISVTAWSTFAILLRLIYPRLDYYHRNHHHHHVVLVARISLTLSRHFSLSFIASGRSSGQHPVSSHSCWMYVRAGRPAFARPCVGVHKSTSLMSS